MEHLPERIAPASLQAMGLRPRFSGLVCVDLRPCSGAPPADARDRLLSFAVPLGEEVGFLFLCRGQAAPALRDALAPLKPVPVVLDREREVQTTTRRMIGFEREEEA